MADQERKTYEEWKKLGYHVIAGKKSKSRNKAGVCVFTYDQVAKNTPSRSYAYYDSGISDGDAYDFGLWEY